MTDEINVALDKASTVAEIDDIYRPYRPKRKTRASVAAEAGLTPLAELMLAQEKDVDIEAEAEKYLNPEKKIESSADALHGAMDIIAETVSDNAAFRKWIREYTMKNGSYKVDSNEYANCKIIMHEDSKDEDCVVELLELTCYIRSNAKVKEFEFDDEGRIYAVYPQTVEQCVYFVDDSGSAIFDI